MVVTFLDTFTSVLAGLIIFGILGNLASKMNAEVGDVVKSGGTGLAFISYPEAIARFNAVPWVSFNFQLSDRVSDLFIKIMEYIRWPIYN